MDENEKLCALAQVAVDEMNTVVAYMRMPKSESNVATYNEIIGDELNHALIAILTFALDSGIQIPMDKLSELMEQDIFKGE